MDDDEDDYDFMEDSLQNERFTVKIGPKGKLTTQHTNRRVVKQRDFFNEFRSKLGDAAATEIIERFNRLNLGTTAQKIMADGVINTLIHTNYFGRLVLMHVLKIGVGRYKRAKKGQGKSLPQSHSNGLQVTEEMIQLLARFVDTLAVDLGYPCQHRRMKKYLTDPGLHTWRDLHSQYSIYVEGQKGQNRVMQGETFRKYMKAYHIDLAFTRAKEDCCDTCIRLSIAVADPNLADEERNLLVLAQNQHATDARTQRLALKSAIKQWGSEALKTADGGMELQHLTDAVENLPDTVEEDFVGGKDELSLPNVRLQCEDFGGNLVLPYFGRTRPGRDFYVSNLSIHNFVISCLSTGQNKVYLYDERSMGKDCDALCSLRWLYHIELYAAAKLSARVAPDTLYIIMDNCVGQNKSQV
jgi:putative component of toxin-antitoxin plasmid stabilization module